jgi:hypothetical protein
VAVQGGLAVRQVLEQVVLGAGQWVVQGVVGVRAAEVAREVVPVVAGVRRAQAGGRKIVLSWSTTTLSSLFPQLQDAVRLQLCA